jgi:hypothetical protein
MEQNLDMHAKLSTLVAFDGGQQGSTSAKAMVCCAQPMSRKHYAALNSPVSARLFNPAMPTCSSKLPPDLLTLR